MEDIFGGAIRAVATERTWEQLTFLESALAAVLAMRVTDARPIYLPRKDAAAGAERELAPQGEWPTDDKYRQMAEDEANVIQDPIMYIDSDDITPRERVRRQKEIDWYLREALVDGVADIKGVGVQITRINIKDVTPIGALKEDAEAASREYQQRKRDNMDTATGLQLARQYLKEAQKNGEMLTLREAMRFTQTDRGRAKQLYVNANTDNPLIQAAAVYAENRS
jgi:hypothetical protein